MCDQVIGDSVVGQAWESIKEFAFAANCGDENCGVVARHGALGILLEAAATDLASGFKLLGFPRASLHYRMTVEVETPQGLRSGSSVLESTLVAGPQTGQAGGAISSLKGETVTVDLPDRQTLFALLSSPSQHSASDFQIELFNNALNAGAVSTPPMPRRYDSVAGFAAGEWVIYSTGGGLTLNDNPANERLAA